MSTGRPTSSFRCNRTTASRGVASTVNDLLVFYDIDGSGEGGMAITRSNHLVYDDDAGTLYDISELEDGTAERGVVAPLERDLCTQKEKAGV